MEDKKYEILRTRKMQLSGVDVFKIKALRTFKTIDGTTINAGDYGGFIESEENLSHEGNCWVGDEAVVYKGATVRDNALVCEGTTVGNECIISGNAMLYGSSLVMSLSGEIIKIKDSSNINNSQIISSVTISGKTSIKESYISGLINIEDSDLGYTNIITNGEHCSFNIKDSVISYSVFETFSDSMINQSCIKKLKILDSITAIGQTIGIDMLGTECEALSIKKIVATKSNGFFSMPTTILNYDIKNGRNLTIYHDSLKSYCNFFYKTFDSWENVAKSMYNDYEKNHCKNIAYNGLLKMLSKRSGKMGISCLPILYKKVNSFIINNFTIDEKTINKVFKDYRDFSDAVDEDVSSALYFGATLLGILNDMKFIANSAGSNWTNYFSEEKLPELLNRITSINNNITLERLKDFYLFVENVVEHISFNYSSNEFYKINDFCLIDNFLIKKSMKMIFDKYSIKDEISDDLIKSFYKYIKNDNLFIKIPERKQ